jgi:hypothetical protein
MGKKKCQSSSSTSEECVEVKCERGPRGCRGPAGPPGPTGPGSAGTGSSFTAPSTTTTWTAGTTTTNLFSDVVSISPSQAIPRLLVTGLFELQATPNDETTSLFTVTYSIRKFVDCGTTTDFFPTVGTFTSFGTTTNVPPNTAGVFPVSWVDTNGGSLFLPGHTYSYQIVGTVQDSLSTTSTGPIGNSTLALIPLSNPAVGCVLA